MNTQGKTLVRKGTKEPASGLPYLKQYKGEKVYTFDEYHDGIKEKAREIYQERKKDNPDLDKDDYLDIKNDLYEEMEKSKGKDIKDPTWPNYFTTLKFLLVLGVTVASFLLGLFIEYVLGLGNGNPDVITTVVQVLSGSLFFFIYDAYLGKNSVNYLFKSEKDGNFYPKYVGKIRYIFQDKKGESSFVIFGLVTILIILINFFT